MNRDILVLGKGYIGMRIAKEFGCAVSGTKIASFSDARQLIKRSRPKTIINCIGSIGRNVDDCERSIDTSLSANAFVPVMLAEASLRQGVRLIHISSGCIFHYDYDLDRPIEESKDPDFFDLFYSRTKIYAEQAIKLLCGRYPFLIVRIRVPLDNIDHPKNLLCKLIRYKQVIDLPNSVTYIPDFLKALKHLLRIRATGLYNVVNKGTLRYPELLDVYKRCVPDFSYTKIDFKKLGMVRTNLILSIKKLEQSGFAMRDVHQVLQESVKGVLSCQRS